MKKQKGLSLIELMISIALGLVLMAGVVQVFISSKTVFVTQQGMSRIQETGRLAVEFIGHDLRMSASYGCVNLLNPNTATGFNYVDNIVPVGTTLHQDFRIPLIGYVNSGSAGAAQVPAGVLGNGFTVMDPSDILVIRGTTEQGMPVFATNNATQIFGFTNETSLTASCVEGFCQNTVGVISNCQAGRFFRVNATPVLAGNKVTLTHVGSWGSGPDEVYATGKIFPVHTIVYFVATRAGSSIPSLWQKIDDDNAVELLQGVENMSLSYGCPTDLGCGFNGLRFADTVPAASWPRISSVRVELLVRALETNNLPDPQPYTFAGQLVSPTANDRTFRQVFNATFAVRSRFN